MSDPSSSKIDLELKEVTLGKSRYAPEKGGWGTFILSLIILPFGILFTDAVFISHKVNHFPLAGRMMLSVMAVLLTLGGLGALTGSLGYIFSRRKRKALEQRYPLEYWRADYPWKAEGTYGEGALEIKKNRWAWMRGLILLSFFSYVTHFHGVLLFFDALLLISFFMILYKNFQKNKYGTPYLKFHRFPYRPGEKIDLTLSLARVHPDFFKNLTVTLRYVYETSKIRRSRSSRDRSSSIVTMQRYAEIISLPQTIHLGPQEIPLTFRPPDKKSWTTRLDQVFPLYWLLEIKNDAPGIDYSETFLVPVYAAEKTKEIEENQVELLS